MVLLIDNYDSFVHNLARYFQRLGQSTVVVRNDAMTVSQVERLDPAAIVLSPGPCGPAAAGISLDLVQRIWQRVPMLGICLGHQTIAAALGANIVRAPEPIHGRTSEILHDGSGLFANIPNPFTAARYHSLIVDQDTMPPELDVAARTSDGIVMAVRCREYPVFGVQFHPESILTRCGYLLLQNFLVVAGLAVNGQDHADFQEIRQRQREPSPMPDQPVTF